MSTVASSSSSSHNSMIGYELQRSLSKAQAIPLFGVIPGVFKLSVSAFEVITGLACAILFGVIGLVFRNKEAYQMAYSSYTHFNHGLVSLFYSLFNILSLGLLAYKIENKLGDVKV